MGRYFLPAAQTAGLVPSKSTAAGKHIMRQRLSLLLTRSSGSWQCRIANGFLWSWTSTPQDDHGPGWHCPTLGLVWQPAWTLEAQCPKTWLNTCCCNWRLQSACCTMRPNSCTWTSSRLTFCGAVSCESCGCVTSACQSLHLAFQVHSPRSTVHPNLRHRRENGQQLSHASQNMWRPFTDHPSCGIWCLDQWLCRRHWPGQWICGVLAAWSLRLLLASHSWSLWTDGSRLPNSALLNGARIGQGWLLPPAALLVLGDPGAAGMLVCGLVACGPVALSQSPGSGWKMVLPTSTALTERRTSLTFQQPAFRKTWKLAGVCLIIVLSCHCTGPWSAGPRSTVHLDLFCKTLYIRLMHVLDKKNIACVMAHGCDSYSNKLYLETATEWGAGYRRSLLAKKNCTSWHFQHWTFSSAQFLQHFYRTRAFSSFLYCCSVQVKVDRWAATIALISEKKWP